MPEPTALIPWLRTHRLEAVAMTAVILALAMWRFGRTVADPDLWGHVRFGLDKIEAGRYLSVDTYSYLTEGMVWFNHEWLGEVIMGAAFLTMGSPGLVVLKATLAAALVVFLTWWLLRLRIPPVRVAILMAINILLLTPTLGTFRPQIFTTVLFTATLTVMVAYSTNRTRLIWLLPLIFAVWVNLHGGVLSGIAVLWTWALLYAVFRKDRPWEAVSVAGVSSAALLLNPHGVAHIRFLVETTTVSRPEIVEWASIDPLSPVGLGYFLVGVGLGVALVRSRHRLDPTLVVPLIGLIVAPLIAWRHLQFFVPATVILGGPYWALLMRTPGSREEKSRQTSPIVAALFVLVSVVAVTFAVDRVAQARDCLVIEAAQFDYPARTVEALASADVTGNAVVTFNWGEYIIWHLGPEVQVSIDGRRETIYSADVLRANLDFADGAGDWDRVLELGPADLVIQATGTPGAQLMASQPGWRLVHEDPAASVFVLASDPLELRVEESIPADGDGLCFGFDHRAQPGS